MNTCETCKYWEYIQKKNRTLMFKNVECGWCDKFVEDEDEKISTQGWSYSYGEGGSLKTAPWFGCALWEAKRGSEL